MSNRYYTDRLKTIAEKKVKARRKRSRPKSFKTEEAAKKWAEANKITNYTLKNLKSTENKSKKIVVIKK
jgi:hypothetical protein